MKYFDNFESSDIDDPIPLGWTRRWAAATTPDSYRRIVKIGSPIFKKREIFSVQSLAGFGLITHDAVDSDENRDDAEVHFAFEVSNIGSPNTNEAKIVGLRLSGSTGSENGYFAYLNVPANGISIFKEVAGTPTFPAETAFTFEDGQSYLGVFRVEGTSRKLKVWNSSVVEPDTWNIENTDSSIAGVGWIGFFGFGANTSGKWNYLSIGTDGDEAPRPLLNADYTAWLKTESVVRSVISEMSANGYEAEGIGSPVEYIKTVEAFASTVGYTSKPWDDPPSKHYPAIINKVPTLSRSLGESLIGQAPVSFGDIIISNPRVSAVAITPVLNFDFSVDADDSVLGLSLAVTNSNATRINSSGLIEAVASNTLRRDYDPTTLAFNGVLIERARTNLCTHSEDFSSWAQVATSTNVNAASGPRGASSMDGIVVSAVNTLHHVFSYNGAITVGDRLIVSVHAKAGSETTFDMYLSSGARFAGRKFDLSNGTTAAADLAATGFTLNGYSMVQHANGSWRCIMDITTVLDVAVLVLIAPRGFNAWTGDGSSNAIYLDAAQMEVGEKESSYISTTAVAATRTADVVSLSTSGWFNASEGTFLAEWSSHYPTNGSFTFVAAVTDGSVNEYIGLYIEGGHFKPYMKVVDGGVAQADMAIASADGSADISRLSAFSYKVNDFAGATDGGTLQSDSAGTLPTVTALYLGSYAGLAQMDGHIKSFQYFPKRRTNAELVTLSAAGKIFVESQKGVRDDWLRIKWKRNYVKVWLGDPSWPKHDFRLILFGRLGQPTTPKADEIRFPISDLSDALKVPVTTQRISSGEYVGQFKPKLFGWVTNTRLEPPRTDQANRVYTINDGPIRNFPPPGGNTVYDNLTLISTLPFPVVSAVDTGTDTITTVAAHGFLPGWRVRRSTGTLPAPLVNDVDYYVKTTPAPDQFTLSETSGGATINITGTDTGATLYGQGWDFDYEAGTLTLVSPAVGRVTCTAAIDDGSIAPYAVAQIYDQIMFATGTLSRNFKDQTSFDSVLNSNIASSGLWMDTQIHLVSDVLEEFAKGTLTWYGFTPDGRVEIGHTSLPQSTAEITFTEANVEGNSLRMTSSIRPIDFTSAQISHSPWFLPGGKFQTGDQEALQGKSFLPAYSYGASSVPLDNYPALADAQVGKVFDLLYQSIFIADLEDPLINLYKKAIGVFEFNTTLMATEISLGQTIELQFSRLGWKVWSPTDPSSPDNSTEIDSTKAVVVGISTDLSSASPYKCKLTVWRQIPGFYSPSDLN